MSGADPVQVVLDRLHGVKPTGGGWTAKCPAHDDRKASLSIGRGDDGRVLLHCHRGCDLDAILGAADLTRAALFVPSDGNGHSSGRPPVIAEYVYREAEGVVRYRKTRTADKQFFFAKPDGHGGWITSRKQNGDKPVMAGVERLLYRYNELRERSENASTETFRVYIPEGEKDADNLWPLDLPATTNDGGAGKWTAALTAQLKAIGVTDVVCLPDNDPPGRAHMQAVARSCTAAGIIVRVVELPGLPVKGDISDWLDAGHTKDELLALVAQAPVWTPGEATEQTVLGGRTLHLTPASQIKVRPVRWCWQDRVALGTLALLGGREGIGKSLVAYSLAAEVTRGTLEGVYYGTPRAVIIAATEDAWEFTIVPRLMAAGANLDLVYRVDVATGEGTEATLTLPKDLAELERVTRESGAVLTLLDPLLSRLDASLDTHKDAEVRQALEPLVAYASATDSTVLGLIHVNKSVSTDLLTTLMASRAFAAVARSVLIVMKDPENETTRLLGQAKNNLGRADLPTLTFTIGNYLAATTDEGEVWTARLQWTGESECSIQSAAEAAAASTGDRSAKAEARDWLSDYLTSQGGSADSAKVKREALKAGHQAWPLREARRALRLVCEGRGFPRETWWSLPASREERSVQS